MLSFRFGMKYTAKYLLIGRIAQVPDDDDGDVPSTANIYPKTANLYPKFPLTQRELARLSPCLIVHPFENDKSLH